jgi:AcrR family transcriptional regulator
MGVVFVMSTSRSVPDWNAVLVDRFNGRTPFQLCQDGWMATPSARTPQRADALSRERIVEAAVAILDAEGERALTFRALTTRLATGAGAVYWHVPNKEALLAAAVQGVVEPVVASAAVAGEIGTEPIEQIRRLAMGVYDAVEEHPWVGGQLVREPWQAAGLVVFEHIGQRLAALGLPRREQFDAATTILSLLLGQAGQRSAAARIVDAGVDRDAFLGDVAARWGSLDADAFPFSRSIAVELPGHDDRAQFAAGIDLVLAGIAERSTRS